MLPQTSEDELRAVLVGATVTAVERRGKYLLLGFRAAASDPAPAGAGDARPASSANDTATSAGDEPDAPWLAIHRKMSGNLLLRSPGAAPDPHTHLEIGLSDGWCLRFVDARKFGRVYLFDDAAERDAFLAARLGPEPLSELDAARLERLIRSRRGRIKSLLLDQAFVAGVGNLYADEALWSARLHPLRTADSLSRAEIRRLAEAIKQVLTLGIERRGTSFSTYRDADDTPGDNQAFLNVYGRLAEPCPRCGTPIARILIAQRSSHFCPRCQRAPMAQAASSF